MARPPNDTPLPAAAAQALAAGRAVEAVKIVRDTLGLGLREAHALVARHAPSAGSTRAAPAESGPRVLPPEGGLVVPQAVADALARGEMLDAIRALRAANRHLDLRGAREALERHGPGHDAGKSVSRRGRATRVPTVMAGDGDGHGWVVALVLALVGLAWWLLERG